MTTVSSFRLPDRLPEQPRLPLLHVPNLDRDLPAQVQRLGESLRSRLQVWVEILQQGYKLVLISDNIFSNIS